MIWIILPILPSQRSLLVYKTKHTVSGRTYWFVEKTLLSGASVSCARFQLFSESLRHIVEQTTGNFYQITNYLDDFLFVARSEMSVNQMVRDFLDICEHIGCPVALDKTEWGASQMVFLGILLDGRRHCLMIPAEKVQKALRLLEWVRSSSKLTIKIVQQLTGTLYFLSRAIVPGRTFTRSLYDKLKIKDSKGRLLKQHHHININKSFRSDCEVWEYFLTNASLSQLCRPYIDLNEKIQATQLRFTTDATLNLNLGMGGIFENRYFAQQWNRDFIIENEPSICYLELYALVTAIVLWGEDPKLCNTRIQILCDNEGVKHMVNNMTGKCEHSMKLIRLLAHNNLKYNCRVFVQYLSTKKNFLADSLSRLEFDRFFKLAAPLKLQLQQNEIPSSMWPMEKIW